MSEARTEIITGGDTNYYHSVECGRSPQMPADLATRVHARSALREFPTAANQKPESVTVGTVMLINGSHVAFDSNGKALAGGRTLRGMLQDWLNSLPKEEDPLILKSRT